MHKIVIKHKMFMGNFQRMEGTLLILLKTGK